MLVVLVSAAISIRWIVSVAGMRSTGKVSKTVNSCAGLLNFRNRVNVRESDGTSQSAESPVARSRRHQTLELTRRAATSDQPPLPAVLRQKITAGQQ